MPASASRKIVNRAAAPAPAPAPQPVQALLPRGVQLQALRLSSPSDPAEREAESTARKVVRMPVPDLAPAVAPAATGIARRAGTAGTARSRPPFVSPYVARFAGALPALARKVEGQPDTGANVAADLTGSLASGSPLPLGVRRFMEPRFNADFSRVRVHTGEQAARLNRQFSAQAFAVGNQVFFGRDRFKPETEEGRELIAHELTHTIQQGAVTQGATVQRSVEPATVTERAAPQVQRLGISDALDYFADKAYNIPGFRMFTIVLGVNPINMSRAERSAANIMRAVVEFLPGGALITQALDNYGVFDRAGAWVEQQIRSLGMTGSIIRDAINRFLDSLGWRDIFNLGGVWDRAKRIFTEPIDRIISFARGLIAGILRFVKDAILRPLAGLAQNTRGYDLLKAILGQDPITGDPYPRNADTLIGGFMKLIGQEEVWQNIKRANAVARAWAWFQGALAGLLGFVRSIPQLFLATLQSLGIADLVVLPRAFAKVAGFFIDVGGRFFSWAGQQVLSLLQIIFEVLAPGAMTYIRRAAGAFQTIIRDPIRFVGNLVRAGILGFRQFAGRFLTHLRTSLINWLTGTLSGANIYIPQAFTIREIIRFVLSVLGLTWQNIRQKIVRVVGEPAMRALETTFDIIVTLVTQGPAAAWEKIQEAIANLREMVMEQIMTFVSERIVQAAITRLLTSLNPAGAFIQAVIAIYNTVMFFVERLRQIAQVAMSFIDSMAAIAAGSLAAAANRVEQTMAGFLTLVISFLARLVGLGNVSQAVTNIVNRIRQPIDRALDRVVEWIVAQARRLGRLVAQAGLPQDPNERLRLGMQAAVAAVQRLAGGRVTHGMIAPVLAAVRLRYGFTELVASVENGTWVLDGHINPRVRITTEVKENLLQAARQAATFENTFSSGALKAFLMTTGKISDASARRIMHEWEHTDRVLFVSRSAAGDAAPIFSFKSELIPAGARETVRATGEAKPDSELILAYIPILNTALGPGTSDNPPYNTITDAEVYRRTMRTAIVAKYKSDLAALHKDVLSKIPWTQNKTSGSIFEAWCAENQLLTRPAPVFVIADVAKIKELQRNRVFSDGARGDALIDAKVRRGRTKPSADSEEAQQMDRYAYVLDSELIATDNGASFKGPFRRVIYLFSDKTLIPVWQPVLEARIGKTRVSAE